MIRRIGILALTVLLSCTATYRSSIPDVTVYLELDLSFEDKDLVPLLSHKIFTSKTVRKASERAGYGGVLIYHALNDAYYAFDIACPHEATPAATVAVDEDNLHASCKKCQSQYDLSYGNANPVGGPSRESLKRYSVLPSGNRIVVRN